MRQRGNAACGLPRADPGGLISHTHWSAAVKHRGRTEQRIAQLFERRYDRPMTSRSAVGFTGMMALAQAINDAGSVDHEKIQVALRALDVPSNATIMPWSGIRFDDDGQNTRAQVVLQQIVKGKYAVVYPRDAATARAIYPLANAR